MADPNHVVLDENKLVFFGPCKTANLSVKKAIADALGRNLSRGLSAPGVWNYRTPAYIAKCCGGDWLKIGVVRNPFDRAVSAYFHTYVKNFDNYSLWRLGFVEGWGFERFAEQLAKLPDSVTEQHFRSLEYDLVHNGRELPDFIVRFENIADDWEKVRTLVLEHCGLKLPALEHRNSTNHKQYSEYYTATSQAAIEARYGGDLTRWGYKF